MYNILLTLFSPGIFLYLLLKRKSLSLLLQYAGCWRLPEGEYFWFHGASFGELSGLMPLIQKFLDSRESEKLLITATNPAAFQLFADLPVECRLLPVDARIFVRRAITKLNASQLIIAETELWPSLLQVVSQKKIPVALVNARISDNSFPRYQKFRFFFKNILQCFSVICCSSHVDRERFLDLGARENSLTVTGNMKYDRLPGVQSEIEKENLQKQLFPEKSPVLVLGSLRPGEEKFWFTAYQKVLKSGKPLQMVVAPRHKEKFEYFANVLREQGLSFHRWSNTRESKSVLTDICLLDTYGMLEKCYSIASVSFIGGSLVPIGGHNPLEAAPYKNVIVMGPYTENVHELAGEMENNGVLHRVKTIEDCVSILELVIEKNRDALLYGEKAFQFWKSKIGATDRVISVLQSSFSTFSQVKQRQDSFVATGV